jgi:hypothetical protein
LSGRPVKKKKHIVSSLKQTTTQPPIEYKYWSFSFSSTTKLHRKFAAMDAKRTGSDLEKLEDVRLDEGQPPGRTVDPRRRRNAITPFTPQDYHDNRRGDGIQPRRNAVAPFTLQDDDDDDVGDEIQVSHSRAEKKKDRSGTEAAAAAAASTSATATAEQKASKQKEKAAPAPPKKESEIHYIRAGRRTIEDESGDIPTQFIVVAKIDKTKKNPKHQFSWLSVATWQLNGLRVGTASSGDRIPERDDFLGYTTGLNPDPFFVARNAGSIQGIREVLLERLERGEVGVQAETLDDEAAQDEREEAQDSRMLEDYGPGVIYGGDKAVRKTAARQDAKLRFPHPWALPVAPTRSTSRFPVGLGGFSSVGGDVAMTPIDVVATFANEIDGGRDLRLKHFMQVAFDPDETLESAKRYFLKGDEGAKFRGLEDNGFLSKKWWLLEIWVLPHFDGCSNLYKWDDVPSLTGRGFCDAKAFEGGVGVEAKLYVEVRIVQDPNHLGGESADDVSSSSSEDDA